MLLLPAIRTISGCFYDLHLDNPQRPRVCICVFKQNRNVMMIALVLT